MTKIKICGITNLEDALKIAELSPDALGFVFYKKSPRYIDPIKAYGIIRQLPVGMLKAGIFVDATEKDVRRTAKLCALDMLQFHGKETPRFCEKFKNYKVIKAFRVKKSIDEEEILKYNVYACLFDTFERSRAGGTGKKFDWKLIKEFGDLGRPACLSGRQLFLSGGLNEKNVVRAIAMIQPDWVDVSSSVEIKPGKKSYEKVKSFIEKVRSII
jgi:phosphoribosylanthranilate isomerase